MRCFCLLQRGISSSYHHKLDTRKVSSCLTVCSHLRRTICFEWQKLDAEFGGRRREDFRSTLHSITFWGKVEKNNTRIVYKIYAKWNKLKLILMAFV